VLDSSCVRSPPGSRPVSSSLLQVSGTSASATAILAKSLDQDTSPPSSEGSQNWLLRIKNPNIDPFDSVNRHLSDCGSVNQASEPEIPFRPKGNVRNISRCERLSSIGRSTGPARFEVLCNRFAAYRNKPLGIGTILVSVQTPV